MKPLIGITPNVKDNFILGENYINAIIKNGGIPFILAYNDLKDIDVILKKLDGILISGGGDIDSKFFNQQLHEKSEIVPNIRDEFELELCKKAVALNKPVLGICRGCQVLNVALGGTINQHIENHSKADERELEKHFVNIETNSILFDVFKTKKLKVNTIHHQCVDKLGKGLKITAVSDDDIIEAIETENRFVVGVQWHPEALIKTNEVHNKIFEKFIQSTNN